MPERITVYLRFPFNRNGFQDPPVAEWDAAKESNLWEYLRTYNKSDIDWTQLAKQYNVPVPFILQQAAWLYEKELEQVRQQMQKAITSEARPRATPATATTTNPSSRKNSRQESNTSLKSTTSSSSSFFGSNHGESSRQLLSKSRNLGRPMHEDDADPDFLPVSQLASTNRTRHESNPSSSITDLSEESISKSALEEALLDMGETSIRR